MYSARVDVVDEEAKLMGLMDVLVLIHYACPRAGLCLFSSPQGSRQFWFPSGSSLAELGPVGDFRSPGYCCMRNLYATIYSPHYTVSHASASDFKTSGQSDNLSGKTP